MSKLYAIITGLLCALVNLPGAMSEGVISKFCAVSMGMCLGLSLAVVLKWLGEDGSNYNIPGPPPWPESTQDLRNLKIENEQLKKETYRE